jgi:hypothetical protein
MTIQNSDVFITVLTTYNYKEKRQKYLENTWLLDVENYIFASDKDEGKNLKLSERTDYQSAEQKQINSIPFLFGLSRKFKYYMFVDDDTFVNVDNLLNFLNSQEIKTAGRILSKTTDSGNGIFRHFPSLEYYSGGAGFLFDRQILEKIFYSMSYYQETPWGDVSLGLIMQKAGIKVEDYSNLFHSFSPKTLNHGKEKIIESITYHYVDPQTMEDLYSLTRDNK